MGMMIIRHKVRDYGHWRPLFLGFARGGKIVATTGGVALAVAPFAALSAAGVWILLFLAFRYFLYSL